MCWMSDFQYCAAISGHFLYLPEYDGYMLKERRWYLIDAVAPHPQYWFLPCGLHVAQSSFSSTLTCVFESVNKIVVVASAGRKPVALFEEDPTKELFTNGSESSWI